MEVVETVEEEGEGGVFPSSPIVFNIVRLSFPIRVDLVSTLRPYEGENNPVPKHSSVTVASSDPRSTTGLGLGLICRGNLRSGELSTVLALELVLSSLLDPQSTDLTCTCTCASSLSELECVFHVLLGGVGSGTERAKQVPQLIVAVPVPVWTGEVLT